MLNLSQNRVFVHRYGREFAAIAFQNDDIAENFVVQIPAEVQSMPAAFAEHDGADGFRGPARQADFDLVRGFDAIARPQLGEQISRNRLGLTNRK